MLDLKDAVKLAENYLTETFPDFAASDLRLEEVESPLQTGAWCFTFSAATNASSTGNSFLDSLRTYRTHKLVQLEKDSGVLLAVKNRAA
jgi:hypothetical protein